VFFGLRGGLNRLHSPPPLPETARRSNSPACHADVTTTFYFFGGSRKSAYVRRNIFCCGLVYRSVCNAKNR
jgi:hypothetical protein